jgi:hypothetical protein
MPDGFALELQKAVRASLVADSSITNLVSTRVFDEPPEGVTFPYIRFGRIEPTTLDTDGSLGADVALTIEGYSQATGRVEATQIAEAIRAALHRQEQSVSLTGYTLTEIITENYFIDRQTNERGYIARVILSAMLTAG